MSKVDCTTKFEQIIKSMAYNDVKSVQIRSYFWSVFSRIRNEYGEKNVQIRRYFWSVFSLIRSEYGPVHIQKNQKKLRIWTLFTQ